MDNNKVFQYVLVKNDRNEKKGTVKSKILGKIETIVAKDADTAFKMAVANIPKDHMEDLEHIDVAVRPF